MLIFITDSIKRCSKCKEQKNLLLFYNSKTQPDGRDYYCKQCRKKLKTSERCQEQRRYYDKTDKAKARYKRYQKSEKGKQSCKRRRDRYRKTEKGRKANNKAKLDYYYKDPEYHRLKARARFHGVKVELLTFIQNRDKVCQMCGKGYDLQFDHIHPVKLGGTASKDNLQLLCDKCNGFKRDNLLLPGGGMLIIQKGKKC